MTCLWLMPFQRSPNRDDGYDISDYYSVDPRFGSLGDFVAFAKGAEQRGLRVIMDLVVNHTSDEHPWFQDARRSASSPFRRWYVWSRKKPPRADEGVVFPGVQKTTWTWDREARAYYFHRFYEFQPDLDTSNPEVQEEIRKIIGFWLELGVSGFRMDAVPFVIARKGAGVKPLEQYRMLRDLRAGFSSAPRTALPVISEGPFRFERVNAADQRRDHESLLNWTERMIRMRKECPEIGWGDFTVLEAPREVLALRYDWRNNSMVVLHNLSGRPATVRLRTRDVGGERLVSLFTGDHSSAEKGRHEIELDPHGWRWYRVGGLDYILRRRSW